MPAAPTMPSPQEVFRTVFRDMHFPLLSADMVALAAFLANPRAAEGCHLELDFPVVGADRLDCVLNAFRGLISRIDPPAPIAAAMCQSPAVRNTPNALKGIAALFCDAERPFAVTPKGSAIRWEELSPWPAAYQPFLDQLRGLVVGYVALLANRRAELTSGLEAHGWDGSNVEVLDQSSRVLPTRWHYAAASLGAWAGGAKNVQFFSQYATAPQIAKPAVNAAYGTKIGYSASVAKALGESGVAIVPASLAMPLQHAQGDVTTFGGLPIDEFNGVNLPERAVLGTGPRGPNAMPGLLVETNYRAAFWARKLRGQALLGGADVLRDHYTEFYAHTTHAGLVRCKHYCAPIIEVGSIGELSGLAAGIPLRSEEGVFYRGQGTLHLLQRRPAVARLLFGEAVRPEPSLVTSAARKRFDYDSLHFALRSFLEEELFGARGAAATTATDYQAWREQSARLTCEIDYALMALAQHYGLPSHGLDVTRDLDVALWFAINKWSKGPTAAYRRLSADEWDPDPTKWPVIFACQQVTHSLGMSLQGCRELEDFGLKALRPSRQKASFFLGGHSDHQNRLAETVVCAFRLKPGDWPTQATFEALFPPPAEDPAYAAMLRFAARPEFAAVGAREVARYH